MVNPDEYLTRFNSAVDLHRINRNEAALAEIDWTVEASPSLRARFNRALILLAMGNWHEGLSEFIACELRPMFRRQVMHTALARGMQPWCGERLCGRRLMLLHTHGFGDTIMALRYARRLRDCGGDVVLALPAELARLGQQVAPIADVDRDDAAYFCPMLHLVHWCGNGPDDVDGRPYVKPRAWLCDGWKRRLGTPQRMRIGIAWSIGHHCADDYPREIPLAQLVAALPNAELHSVQTGDELEAETHGVQVHAFEDFEDCAAFMMQMDRIVSVDTAALHLAGAIGHPDVTGLLSHWHSWRWRARWYQNVRLCRQQAAGDWPSALAQMQGAKEKPGARPGCRGGDGFRSRRPGRGQA